MRERKSKRNLKSAHCLHWLEGARQPRVPLHRPQRQRQRERTSRSRYVSSTQYTDLRALIQQTVVHEKKVSGITMIDNVNFALQLHGTRQFKVVHTDMFDGGGAKLGFVAALTPGAAVRLDARMHTNVALEVTLAKHLATSLQRTLKQLMILFEVSIHGVSSGANKVAAHIKGAHVLAGMMRPVVVAVQQAVALEHLVLAMAANPIGHVRMILPEMVAKLVLSKKRLFAIFLQTSI